MFSKSVHRTVATTLKPFFLSSYEYEEKNRQKSGEDEFKQVSAVELQNVPHD